MNSFRWPERDRTELAIYLNTEMKYSQLRSIRDCPCPSGNWVDQWHEGQTIESICLKENKHPWRSAGMDSKHSRIRCVSVFLRYQVVNISKMKRLPTKMQQVDGSLPAHSISVSLIIDVTWNMNTELLASVVQADPCGQNWSESLTEVPWDRLSYWMYRNMLSVHM